MSKPSPTVCIIDDDAQVQSSLSFLLQVAGFEVSVFESAEAFLTSSTFDKPAAFGCLVLDVRLPGMSGLELLDELNQREVTVPVFLVSGHANEEVVERGLANGAKALFEKPFDGRELVAAVTDAVAGEN